MVRAVLYCAMWLGVAVCGTTASYAGLLTYDPTTGLTPTDLGWAYTTTGGGPTSLTVGGGVMTLVTGISPRAVWDGNLMSVGNAAGTDIFMESRVRIASESHTTATRGVNIFEIQRTTAGATGTTNEVDGYAWTDKIFWTNTLGTIVGEYALDTTVEHVYRVEVQGTSDYIYVDGALVGAVLNNTYENGNPGQQDVLRARFGDGTAASGSTTEWRSVIAGALTDGITPETPVLPNPPPPGEGGPNDTGVFVFNNVPTGRWFDPPIAYGYLYQMTTDALFTSIGDFPTGFDAPFLVTANGQSWFGSPGNPIDFVALLGAGVSSFTITGISPLVDPEDPQAFPLLLNFNTDTASFTMTALTVPEPASFAIFAVSGLALFGAGSRRRAQAARN